MIIDITRSLYPSMVRWEGDPPMQIKQVMKLSKGDPYNLSKIKMSVHQGTHMDAPRHFLDDGILIEDIPLDKLIGDAQIVEIPDEIQIISAEVLKKATIQSGIKRILLKTRNSTFWKETPDEFRKDFASLSLDGAQNLIDRGIEVVGIDYLSISPDDDFAPVHKCLMESKVVIIETLDLSEVKAGVYTLICLPMKLKDVEGAPVRAVLLTK